ncbi:hypothetical protein GQ43DRAFT_444457 [Delitschia confertaspora ATCC 74209]|uniref:Uncharacterized protein n=1 Tax=Delitschia confertaspora ATCC 74209 TaxID=1513339 RepID=A0A9P4MRP7_9PLEO|nr:hypothetical protein GQ43DRAFT_444457 [Delitschia confertaspora ATCC 74209]
MDLRRPVRHPTISSRRNLFAATLGRRNHTNHHLFMAPDNPATNIQIGEQEQDDSLVERDEQGRYQMEAPSVGMRPVIGVEDEMVEEREAEAKVIEMYGKQRGEELDPADLKLVLEASLERKVQSLEDDKWMFEGEVAKFR